MTPSVAIGLLQFIFAPSDEHDLRARRGQAARHAETETGAAARDERGLAGQIEGGIDFGFVHARQPTASDGVSWCLYMIKYSAMPEVLLGSARHARRDARDEAGQFPASLRESKLARKHATVA